MNPFDWPGPQFLVFYVVFGAVLWWAVRHYIGRREAHLEIPRLNLADPYEIAMLRGGRNEAMRVAAISLVDRGLLMVGGEKLAAKDKGAVEHVRRPIEKAMLEHFSSSKTAHQMYTSIRLRDSCNMYEKTLQDRNLLPNGQDMTRRLLLYAVSICLALGVSLVKIEIATSRGRPVGFLVILTIVLCILLTRDIGKHRTVLGDRVIADLKTLFQGLKGRAHLLRTGGDTNEVALLVAVYGISALSSGHDYAKLLFPKAANSGSGCGGSSCSTGCGSSCGGGGGGGGCGGCGGGGD